MKDSSEVVDRVSRSVAERGRRLFRWSEDTRSPWPEIAVVAIVAAALLFLVRRSWFFGDDWAFLEYRHQLWASGNYGRALFVPHNEHLSLLPAVVYLVLEPIVGMGSAFPYLLVTIAGHVALLWALRTVLVRLRVPMWGRLLALVWFGLFGAGAENLVWPFQMGFIWAFAFAAWGLLVVTKPGPASVRRDLGACALFLAAILTASTALGVLAVSIVVVAVATRSIVRVARVFLVPVVFYAVWYVTYGSPNMVKKPVSFTTIVPYFTRGITNGLDRTIQFTGLGLLLGFGALLAVAIVKWFDRSQRITVAVLGSILALFYLLSAFGRGAFGVVQSEAVRYVYFCGALSIPILVLVMAAIVRRHPGALSVLGVLVLVAIVGNVTVLVTFRNDRFHLTQDSRWKIAVAALYADRPFVNGDLMPDPTYTPDLTIAKLGALRRDGLWSPGVDPTPRMLVDGASAYGWRVLGGPGTTSASASPAHIDSVVGGAASRSGACVTVTPAGIRPTVSFSEDPPGAFSIETTGMSVTLRFTSTTAPDVSSAPSDLLPFMDVGATWIAIYPVGARAVLTLPSDQPTKLCGVTGG